MILKVTNMRKLTAPVSDELSVLNKIIVIVLK